MPSVPISRIICDEEDKRKISLISWTEDSDGRVRASIDGKTVRLHQFILPGHELIDHANGNQFDVRKTNLRPATHVTNGYNRTKTIHNTSGYKGVHRRKDCKKEVYTAKIVINKQQVRIGQFTTAEAAARAYDRAAIKHHGEFCNLNFCRADYD